LSSRASLNQLRKANTARPGISFYTADFFC